MVLRKIVQIDETLCDGCGKCVLPCAEGAITIVDGKAKVINESLCDGAGLCLGICPTGALKIVEREAEAFDAERAATTDYSCTSAGSELTCFICGMGENDRVLLPVRDRGASNWVCVACLPRLIHG